MQIRSLYLFFKLNNTIKFNSLFIKRNHVVYFSKKSNDLILKSKRDSVFLINLNKISNQKKDSLNQLKQLKKQSEIESLNQSFKQPLKEASPIRKLLRVKDFVDFLIVAFLGVGIYIGYKNYKKKKESEIKFDWLLVPKLKHKLFESNGYLMPEYLAKNLNAFKNFHIKKDDIWVVSFPKSGTTWIQEIVYLIVNDCDFEKAKLSSIENRSPFIDFPSPGIDYINKLKSPRIIKTHLPALFLPDNFENECKVIYILRNPKDVSVSYYHFAKLSTEAEYSGTFDDFGELFMQGSVPYGPWWKHVDDYSEKKNVFLIHYEDLHQNPVKTIESLCKFLGKELEKDKIDSIVKWCSFESMKQNPSVNYDWYKEIGLFKKNGSFFRKGKIGDWLNHFDLELSKKFDQIIGQNLKYNKNLNYGLTSEELNKIYDSKK